MNEDQTTPTVPPAFRTGLYITGAFTGAIGAAILTDAPLAARILVAVSVAANGVAFGYRPTR